MATFSQALDYLLSNEGARVKRDVIKNDTVIILHKKRLYQMSTDTGVRYPYVPTNKDLIADDWIMADALTPKGQSQLIMNITEEDLKHLKLVRNYFGEHDKTLFEHRAYAILDKLLHKLELSRFKE